MSRIYAWIIAATIVVLIGGYWENRYFAERAARKRSQTAAAAAAISEPQLPAAATPEDPGEVKVVGPLAVWTREANEPQEDLAAANGILPIDRAFPSREPARGFRTTFELTTSADCRFVIPPHTVNPQLRGYFQSFTRRSDPQGTSDRNADIGLLLLTAREFDKFLQGRQGDAILVVDRSHHHNLDYALNSAHDQSEEYYLVFQNYPRKTRVFVTAEFTVYGE